MQRKITGTQCAEITWVRVGNTIVGRKPEARLVDYLLNSTASCENCGVTREKIRHIEINSMALFRYSLPMFFACFTNADLPLCASIGRLEHDQWVIDISMEKG